MRAEGRQGNTQAPRREMKRHGTVTGR
jgi:hypothetical protein